MTQPSPDPVEALRAAYWRLRGHAASYRSTDVYARRQAAFKADPDNVTFAKGATRDAWYARGIEAAADDLAELLDLEYDVYIDPDPDAPSGGHGHEHVPGTPPHSHAASCSCTIAGPDPDCVVR